MKFIFSTIINLAIVMVVAFSFTALLPTNTVSAAAPESKQAACDAIGGCDGSSGRKVSSLLSKVINFLSWLVGLIAVIMIIVGGFKFIISGGDPNATKSARNTIIYALVGVAVAALAQLMVRFVLNKTIQ